MKRDFIYNKIKIFVSLLVLVILTSCEDYLDKAPDSDITETDVYANFTSFQGFIEELYNCLPDYSKVGAPNPWLYADECLNNYVYWADQGNYWAMDRSYQTIFLGPSANTSSTVGRDKYVWNLSWYGIRKANLGLSKMDLLVDATDEERNFIKGQALFFRAFFHFQIMSYWGGMPYIDELLSPEALDLPRLNYQETALKAAEDFKAAAELLPLDWDDTQAGQTTLGDNWQRINKIHALAYLGKNLLYAASPMMNEESTGNNSYNAGLCKEAASAFAEALNLCDQTGRYELIPWDNWTDNFWVLSASRLNFPGGTEVIMSPPAYDPVRIRWSAVNQTVWYENGGSSTCETPTHSYVKNYAMANGLPIDDPESGYDPKNPWENREPRFYKDIIVDGDQVVKSSSAPYQDRFIQLYTGGRHRSSDHGSVTGYYYKRWTPIGCNKWDSDWSTLSVYIPYLRLADVYLMYAEAVLHGYGSPSSKDPNYSLTATDAVNIIRNRAQLPDLASKYTADKNVFMGEIIRERAVELAFEATHRFCDLRRWNVHTQLKYREKTAIDFERGEDGTPVNFKERVVITRVTERKHNWLPIPSDYTKLYAGFDQNPGW